MIQIQADFLRPGGARRTTSLDGSAFREISGVAELATLLWRAFCLPCVHLCFHYPVATLGLTAQRGLALCLVTATPGNAGSRSRPGNFMGAFTQSRDLGKHNGRNPVSSQWLARAVFWLDECPSIGESLREERYVTTWKAGMLGVRESTVELESGRTSDRHSSGICGNRWSLLL